MNRQLALQRGFQALEDELSAFARGSVRRERRTRNRPRVQGSWRDQGKGECFTRTNASGGRYVVCNDPPRGSRGQKGVYDINNRNVRGDEDQKGRDKTKAIKNNRSVMKKYDAEGRVEDLDEEIYFTPLREEGGFVVLGRGLNTAGTAKNPDGISENVDTVNTIRVPKDEFNAQYRVMRGFTNPDDKYNDLAPAEYELQEDPDKGGRKAREEEIDKLEKKIDKKYDEAREEFGDEQFGARYDEYIRFQEREIEPLQERQRRLREEIVERRPSRTTALTPAQEAIKLQREVRGERLRQEEQQERVDEFVREAQELGGGREGFRRRQRRRELGRQAIRKIKLTQQDRLDREQRRRDLVESFEDKVKDLRRLREGIYQFTTEGKQEIDKLEREVGQELDRRQRIEREKREEEERREQREAEEYRRQQDAEALELGRRTLRDRAAGILTETQYYSIPNKDFVSDLRTSGNREIPMYYQEGIDKARAELSEVREEEKEEKKEKKEKKKKKKDKRKKSSKEKDKERAKEEQGEDFDEEDWEDDYEEYLENKKQFDENKEAFRKEPLVKRYNELLNQVSDLQNSTNLSLQILEEINKDTGVKERYGLVDYKGQQFKIRRAKNDAVEYGYDGTPIEGTLLGVSLRGTIDKLEKIIAL